MKRYIICTTDFEPEAFKALEYSCMLAGQMNCSVTLLHVQTFGLFISATFGNGSAFQEQFKEQIQRIRKYHPDVEVNTDSVTGAVVEGINDYIQKNGAPLLVVAGNKYNASYSVVPGGHLLSMLRHINAPVLSVPYQCDSVRVKRIAFAFDDNFSGVQRAFSWLRSFCIEQDLELHFLIGWTDAVSYDNSPDLHPEAVEAMQGVNYKLHFFKKIHLEDQLAKFAQANHFHMLCVVPRTYNLIKTVYHHSITKDLFMNIRLPLLALHEDNQP